jgi:hypothetical protein
VAYRWSAYLLLVADPKTAANIVPLVLIPQIIMGGALIKYEDMNRNLALVYALHWFPTSQHRAKQEDGEQAGDPFITSSLPCAGTKR